MTSRKQASCSSVIYLKSLDHRHFQSHFDTQCVPGRPQKLEPTESSISFFPKKQRRDQNLSFSLEVSFSLFVVGIEVGFVFIPRATYRGWVYSASRILQLVAVVQSCHYKETEVHTLPAKVVLQTLQTLVKQTRS